VSFNIDSTYYFPLSLVVARCSICVHAIVNEVANLYISNYFAIPTLRVNERLDLEEVYISLH
jgi:hypothetical protein